MPDDVQPDLSKTDLSKPDLSKIAVGMFAGLAGQPVDYAKSVIYDRAGLPPDAPERTSLVHTHASSQGKAVPRLPDPFPPAALPAGQKLETAQDYLALIAATPPIFIATPSEIAKAQKEAVDANAEAEAAEKEAEAAEKNAADIQQNAATLAQQAEAADQTPRNQA